MLDRQASSVVAEFFVVTITDTRSAPASSDAIGEANLFALHEGWQCCRSSRRPGVANHVANDVGERGCAPPPAMFRGPGSTRAAHLLSAERVLKEGNHGSHQPIPIAVRNQHAGDPVDTDVPPARDPRSDHR